MFQFLDRHQGMWVITWNEKRPLNILTLPYEGLKTKMFNIYVSVLTQKIYESVYETSRRYKIKIKIKQQIKKMK